MENKNIYIKNINHTTNNLKIDLGIYNSDLPEFTLGSKVFPAIINEITGSIMEQERITEIQILRPEENRTISVPLNYPIEHIEDLIKKELEASDCAQKDAEEKLAYFKNKVYSNQIDIIK